MCPCLCCGGSGTGALKIIDLGAAADLRVGINYNPNEFLLDPRWGVCNTSCDTCRAPPVLGGG